MYREDFYKRTPEQRFWEKVDKKSDNECWNWTAALDRCGYGCFKVNRRALKAHRYSFELHGGVLQKGLELLHECDNPNCVNPKHLRQGTHGENMFDFMAKKAEKHKFSKSPLFGFRKPQREEENGPLWCRCTIPTLTSTMGIGPGMAHCMRCGCNYYH